MANESAPHGWVETLVGFALGGGLIGALVALWNAVVNRHKPGAEVHESQARTRKTLAEARVSTDDYLDRIQTKHAKAVFDALKLKQELTEKEDRIRQLEESKIDLMDQSRSQQELIRQQDAQIEKLAEEVRRLK